MVHRDFSPPIYRKPQRRDAEEAPPEGWWVRSLGKFKAVGAFLDWWRAVIVSITILILFGSLVYVVWANLGDQPVVLKSIEVPASLGELGLTPDVFTSMVRTRIRELQNQAREIEAQDTSPETKPNTTDPANPTDSPGPIKYTGPASNKPEERERQLFALHDESLTKLTLPGTEASLQVLITLINRFLGFKSPEIEVEVLQRGTPAAGDKNDTAVAVTYAFTMSVTGADLPPDLMPSRLSDATEMSFKAADVQDLIEAVAQRAYWISDPIGFARMDLDFDESTDADSLSPELMFSPFSHAIFRDDSREYRRKEERIRAFLQNCAEGYCRPWTTQPKALLLLAEIAQHDQNDGDVIKMLEKALHLHPSYVERDAILVLAEAQLRAGNPARAEELARPICDDLSAQLQAEFQRNGLPSSRSFQEIDPREIARPLLEACAVVVNSSAAQLHMKAARRDLASTAKIYGQIIERLRWNSGPLDLDELTFHLALAERGHDLIAKLRATGASHSTGGADMKPEDRHDVDELASLAIVTNWPGLLLSFKQIAADQGASSRAAEWVPLVDLKYTENLDSIGQSVAAFDAFRKQYPASNNYPDVAELAVIGRSVIPLFHLRVREFLKYYSPVPNFDAVAASGALNSAQTAVDPDLRSFADGLQATVKIDPERQLAFPPGPPDSAGADRPEPSCISADAVSRSAIDISDFINERYEAIRATSDSMATDLYGADPPASWVGGQSPELFALRALCEQFARGASDLDVVETFVSASSTYAMAAKLTGTEEKFQLLHEALEKSGTISGPPVDLLAGKILFELGRYPEVRELLKTSKMSAGILWLARTQAKLGELDAAWDGLTKIFHFDDVAQLPSIVDLESEEAVDAIALEIVDATPPKKYTDEMPRILDRIVGWNFTFGYDDPITVGRYLALERRANAILCKQHRIAEAHSRMYRVELNNQNFGLDLSEFNRCWEGAAAAASP